MKCWSPHRGFIRAKVFAVAFLAFSFSLPAYAAPGKVIFYLDKDYRPVVRIDRIQPISKAMKAILAMYALQNDSGCDDDGDAYHCSLTDALGMGAQCSKKHIEVVRSWFKKGIPHMGFLSGTLEDECYNTPLSATNLQKWDLIRVWESGNRVKIYAHMSWVNRESTGTYAYVSTYEIGNNSITVLSHKEMTGPSGPK